MSEKDLEEMHGFDFATGRIRPLSEGTRHYKAQPYMPHLATIQQVMLDFDAQAVSVVEHKESCAGKYGGIRRGKDCDCDPDVVLHFQSGEKYRYRTAEPEAERFLRAWLQQTGVR